MGEPPKVLLGWREGRELGEVREVGRTFQGTGMLGKVGEPSP